MGRLRNYFLTGVIVSAPLAITAYIAWSLVGWVDSWVKPYIPAQYNPDNWLGFQVPGFGLVVALVLITLIGFLTANIVGRSVLGWGERLLNRMPFIRAIYRATKQIFETVLADKADMFKKVGLVEYPHRGAWSIVFIASDQKTEISDRLAPEFTEIVAVFLPCTPNPTTGYLIYLPRSEIIELDMTVEEAAKLVISAGLVTPQTVPVKTAAQPAESSLTASSLPNK